MIVRGRWGCIFFILDTALESVDAVLRASGTTTDVRAAGVVFSVGVWTTTYTKGGVFHRRGGRTYIFIYIFFEAKFGVEIEEMSSSAHRALWT